MCGSKAGVSGPVSCANGHCWPPPRTGTQSSGRSWVKSTPSASSPSRNPGRCAMAPVGRSCRTSTVQGCDATSDRARSTHPDGSRQSPGTLFQRTTVYSCSMRWVAAAGLSRWRTDAATAAKGTEQLDRLGQIAEQLLGRDDLALDVVRVETLAQRDAMGHRVISEQVTGSLGPLGRLPASRSEQSVSDDEKQGLEAPVAEHAQHRIGGHRVGAIVERQRHEGHACSSCPHTVRRQQRAGARPAGHDGPGRLDCGLIMA